MLPKLTASTMYNLQNSIVSNKKQRRQFNRDGIFKEYSLAFSLRKTTKYRLVLGEVFGWAVFSGNIFKKFDVNG